MPLCELHRTPSLDKRGRFFRVPEISANVDATLDRCSVKASIPRRFGIHSGKLQVTADLSNMTQVLYSTTRQWNPGDEIILRGVRHLIEKIAPGHNPVIWNRNPSIRPGNTSLDNSFDSLRHSLQSMDYVVFAGSPEWTGCRNIPLFQDLLKNDTRCSFIGIGSAFSGQLLDQATVSVMQTKTDCIISRDQTTSDILQGWGIPCSVLPCPSIFSNAKRKPRTATGKIGLNFQGTRTPWQRIDPVTGKRCFDIFQMLMSEFDCTVICNYIDELDEATSLFPRDRIRYSYDSSEYLDFFQEVDVVIGTRLHSCLGAIACGTPAILLGTENDLRLRGASEIVPVLATANVLNGSSVLHAVRNLDVELESRKIIDWIDTSERLYQPFLDRMASRIVPQELSTARSSSPATIYADIQQKIAASKPLTPDIKTFVLHFPVTIRLPELCLAVSGVLLEKFRPKFSFRAQYRRLRDGSISNYLRYKLGLTNKVRISARFNKSLLFCS